MNQSKSIVVVLVVVVVSLLIPSDAQSYKHGAKLTGKNATLEQGRFGTTQKRSLLANGNKRATMTMNSFERGGDGGGPSKCDGKYHSNRRRIVALSTRWYNHGERCFELINIHYHDKNVKAMVVDECDSNNGCADNVVDASTAVWRALQVSGSDWGKTEITWSDV